MGESETDDIDEQEPTETENLVNHSQELIETLRTQNKEKKGQELLEQLPQGEGSGLDADTVDGLHASEILSTIKKGAAFPMPLGSGAGETAVHGNEKHNPTMVTEASHTKAQHDALGINAATLEGSTKAQVQDHAPKAHTHPIADLTNHNTAAHNALDIDADTLDGAHAADFAAVAHNHNLNDLTEKSHTSLTDKGTKTHAEIDTFIASKGAASGLCDLTAGSKVPAAKMATGKVTKTLTFHIPGTLTTGQKKMRILADAAITLLKVRLVIDTAPTGADLIVDVHTGTNAGTTIFTTQTNRPTIAAGSKTGVSVAPDVTNIAEGDEFSVYIDQIGSTIAGADLTIEVVAEQTVTFS